MTKACRYNHFVIFALIHILGLGLALALPWLLNSQSKAAHQIFAPTPPNTCYATLNNGATQYDSVQKAVDAAAPGDVIKLAGTCTGVETRAGLTQTVFISKSLTLEGGHTQNDWTLAPDPKKSATTLDADKGGRVIVISGTIDVTLDSLFLTGGLTEDGPEDDGAGIWTNSGMTLTNSIIYSNTADGFGGGMHNDGVSSVLTKVTFSGNSAYSGGAIFNWAPYGTSSPNLTNVTFSGNSANRDGGAMYNYGYLGTSSPHLTNVTFSGNYAKRYGGAMYNYGEFGNCTVNVYNSILWNNKDISSTETINANISNNSALIILTHSLIEGSGGSGSGWIGGSYLDGLENIDEDPLFIEPISPTTAPTTTGNLRLQDGSPAIDVGDNDHVVDIPTDLDGNQRIIAGVVDMGAYEKPVITLPLIIR